MALAHMPEPYSEVYETPAGPPPLGRVRRTRRLPVLAVGTAALLVALVGCTSSTAGTPSAASSAASPEASASATDAPDASTQAAPTTSDATSPGGGTAKCPGGAIAPAGAVYCYSIPTGFVDVTSTVSLSNAVGATSSFSTAVSPSKDVERDAIVVQQFGLNVDADTLSQSAIQSAFADTVQQFAQSTKTTIAPANPAVIQVDGARTLVYEQTGPEYSAHQYFTFRGKHEVQVGCQYKQQQTEIERGCADVLQSLQIAS